MNLVDSPLDYFWISYPFVRHRIPYVDKFDVAVLWYPFAKFLYRASKYMVDQALTKHMDDQQREEFVDEYKHLL